MSDTIIFAEEPSPQSIRSVNPWKLFIVDDDKDIHEITKLALKDLKFKERPISFSSAYSAEEAIELLKEDPQFSIVLLDIGMETNDAGLEVAKFIRQELKDDITRIIIRTGQPGDVPKQEIIDTYDINDYKSKTELTLEKLFSSIRTAIAQYDQINELARLNKDLEARIKRALQRQKEQQEALFIQNHTVQMGELLTMLAHQWRQPLSCISAVSTQLKLSLTLGEIDQKEFEAQVDSIEGYTHELSKTIDAFRTVYEPSGLVKNVPICELLKKSRSIIQNSFKEQNIEIDILCGEEEKSFIASTELYQVILSILKNAQESFLHKSIPQAMITIIVTKDEQRLNISIEDNAGGIDEDIFEQIFDPYFSTKENKNGHGLGLYMSKNIIEKRCHGKLYAQKKDDGTCFTISLPNK